MHLLSHHIIYGEVVVPGATYIEMVTATAAFRMGKEHTKFSLVGIGFQNPFVIRPVNGEMLTQTEFCLHLHDNMKWAMHSSESGEIKQTHSEGSLDFSNPAAEKRRLDVEDVRSRCPQEVPNANMYEPFATIGLPLQPRFRTVRSIVRSVFDPALNRGDKDDELIAWVAAEEDGTNAGMIFGPAVIDGSFQASCAFQNLDALPSQRIPLSIDRVTLYGQGFSQKCWVHHVMLENGEKQMDTNVVLAREDETVVMTMDRMRLREVRPEHIAKMLAAAAGDADEDILEVQWTALELKDGKADRKSVV